jgi:hypothetical protein
LQLVRQHAFVENGSQLAGSAEPRNFPLGFDCLEVSISCFNCRSRGRILKQVFELGLAKAPELGFGTQRYRS